MMVAALVLTSCAKEVTPTEEGAVTPGEEAVTPEVPAVNPSEAALPSYTEWEEAAAGTTTEVVGIETEMPKYGGWVNLITNTVSTGWDEALTRINWCWSALVSNENLLTGDWAKGPAGTNEADFVPSVLTLPYLTMGQLAEKWDLIGDNTIMVYVRQGVHWALNPKFEASQLVGGREFTADDVIATWERFWASPVNYLATNVPKATCIVSCEALDKYTIKIVYQPGKRGMGWQMMLEYDRMWPHEVWEKYGNFNDWKRSVGTGPFMLDDYVDGAYATMIRNPDYYGRDPVGPGKGNQLPYLDGFKFLFIVDASTRLAALRTGQADFVVDVPWEDSLGLIKTNPELKYKNYLGAGIGLAFRMDKPEQPWADIRVRQALTLAIDRPAIARDYYGGYAELLDGPVKKCRDFGSAYIPLDQLPASTQELFTYQPAKARQLLADAGYAKGFSCEIPLWLPEQVDMFSIVKKYWADVGVDLKLQTIEYGASRAIYNNKTWAQLWPAGHVGGWPYDLLPLYWGLGTTPAVSNTCMLKDPQLEHQYDLMNTAYHDYNERNRLMAEITPYILDNCWIINMPSPYSYEFWTPWIKNFHGEYCPGNIQHYRFVDFIWLDQDLKEEMTGKR